MIHAGLSVLCAVAAGADRPLIVIEGGQFRPLPLAVAPFLADRPGEAGTAGSSRAASTAAARELEQTVGADLFVSGLFDVLDAKSFLADPGEGLATTEIKWPRWTDVGAEALVKAAVAADGGTVRVDFRLYTVVAGREELKRGLVAPRGEARRLAHQFADEVFRFYTREEGAFQTRMAFVRKVGKDKRIYVADWDGHAPRPISDTSLSVVPSWSRDGRQVAFTGYRSDVPELLAADASTGALRTLVRTGRLVTGAAWSPDGKRFAYSMSEPDGDSHLFVANADGSSPRKLTNGWGINTSPTWSPDGKRVAYVSNSAGTPQIYLLEVGGGPPKRLTFQGTYNQTPDWSPRGDLIAFTARDERNVFDLFTVDPESFRITRLTQDQGHNEEPSFAPNGRLIAFTSTRTGRSTLWVMSADGKNQRQVTSDREGEVFTPAWGPLPR